MSTSSNQICLPPSSSHHNPEHMPMLSVPSHNPLSRKVVFVANVAQHSFEHLGHTPLPDVDLITEIQPLLPSQTPSYSLISSHKGQPQADDLQGWIYPVLSHMVRQKRKLSEIQISLIVSALPLKELRAYFIDLPKDQPEDIEFLVQILDSIYQRYPDALSEFSDIEDQGKKQMAEFIAITSPTSQERSESNPSFTVKHPLLKETRYLKPEIVTQIIDPTHGEIKERYAHYSNVCFCFKSYPNNPLMEYAVHRLSCLLGKALAPYTQLLRFEGVVNGTRLMYPLLMSRAVEDVPQQVLKKNLKWDNLSTEQQEHWTLIVLFSILVHPRNYIFDANNNLFCIDNSESFSECIKDVQADLKPDFNSIPFQHFEDAKLNFDILLKFTKVNPEEILKRWLEEIKKKEEEYTRLFTLKERFELFTEREGAFTTGIVLREGVIATLFVQFKFLKAYILLLDRHNPVSPLQLLEQLVSLKYHVTVHRPAGYYLKKFALQRKTTLLQDPVLQAKLNFDQLYLLSAGEALNELLHVLENGENASPTTMRQKLEATAKSLLKDLSERVILRDRWDDAKLTKNTKELFVIDIRTLAQANISQVAAKCPSVKKIYISGCKSLKQLDFTAFTHLEVLTVDSCVQKIVVNQADISEDTSKLVIGQGRRRVEPPSESSEIVKKPDEHTMVLNYIERASTAPSPLLSTEITGILVCNIKINQTLMARIDLLLKTNSHIKRLHIVLAEIEEEHVSTLLAMCLCHNLKELNISSNKLTLNGVNTIIGQLKGLDIIVDLRHNLLSQSELEDLKAKLDSESIKNITL